MPNSQPAGCLWLQMLDDDFSASEWANLIHKLISLGIQVAKVVEPVVSNASPEGHLPMDPDSDTILKLQTAVRRSIGKRFQSAVIESEDLVLESDQVVLDKVKTHAVTAQILLLCCWRTHKEISLLFGEISDRIPVSCDDIKSGILNVTQVKDIGDYFMHQMASVKHKGAFEQAYIGFTKLCKMLWKSSIPELQKLPQNWLNDLCLAIKGFKDDKNFCYTRRSAGLPFIMQAILTSEPGISSSSFFKNTISSLLSMTSSQKDNGNIDEMVHALNILRALFRDSCLSDVLIPFVSEALIASITGFKSNYWVVRNSSTLLFSALMTRIFGVSGPQDEVGKKNKMTGRTFFSYYKEIYAFLYEELKQCTEVMNQNQESLILLPSLYPILLVLGRLYPAPGECDSRLTSFIPFLNVCSGSSIWKVRALAAQALVPLISAENCFSTLQSLFDSLPHNDQAITGHNQIHGTCLQIMHLLRESCQLPADRRTVIEENIHSWMCSHSKLSSKLNPCYTTRVAFLEVILLGIFLNSKSDNNLLLNMINDVLSEIHSVSSNPDITCMIEHYLCLSVNAILLSFLQTEPEQVYDLLKKLDSRCDSLSSLIQKFLETPYESVRCMVLHCLVCIFQKDSDTYHNDLNSSVIPIFFSNMIASSISVLKKKNQCIFDVLLNDCGFSAFLLRMLAAEENSSSCLGKVCHILSFIPSVINQKWDVDNPLISSCFCSKLEFVLGLLQNCKRDGISNLILLFASHLGIQVYLHLLKPTTALNSADCTRYLHILRRWCEILEESAQPENCISKRKTVVMVFKEMPQGLFLNEFQVLDGLAIKLWQTLMSFITDDEPEIKQIADEFITSIKTSQELERKILPSVPSFSLDYMMKIFITENICPPSRRIAVLLNWMLTCKIQAIDCMGDEQPFDRGELNVYAEDLFLAKMSYDYLCRYLQSLNWQDISSLKICDWKVLSDSNNAKFTIDEVVSICLDELKEFIGHLLSRKAVSSLLDTNFDLDILQISQRLYAVSCFAHYVSVNVSYQALGLLKDLKKIKFRSFFFSDLLSVVHESLVSSLPCIT